jgi:hypothetical protein
MQQPPLLVLSAVVRERPPSFVQGRSPFVSARPRFLIVVVMARGPHGPSLVCICNKYIVSIFIVVILLTFKTRIVHLNINQWLVFNIQNYNLLFFDVGWE